jgi:hypothetical protein
LEPKEYEKIGNKIILKKFETKEYERYRNQNNMEEIGNKRIRKILKLKEYERNWKQKNMKAIGTKIK